MFFRPILVCNNLPLLRLSNSWLLFRSPGSASRCGPFYSKRRPIICCASLSYDELFFGNYIQEYQFLISSLPVVVAQPYERHASRTAVLEWLWQTQSIQYIMVLKRRWITLLSYFPHQWCWSTPDVVVALVVKIEMTSQVFLSTCLWHSTI